jgi:hypothetical protein
MNAEGYHDALLAQTVLDAIPAKGWAETFVYLKMDWFRKHANGLICSCEHGLDYFKHIIAAYECRLEWNEKGDYGENFRRMTSAS